MQQCGARDQTPPIQMARTHSQDGPGPHPQDRPTMDSTWGKTWEKLRRNKEKYKKRLFKRQVIDTISQRKSKGPGISQSNGVKYPLQVSILIPPEIRYLYLQLASKIALHVLANHH